MQYTIKELLGKYRIIIPRLQRDYAQGRENESEIRKSFVLKLKQALQSNTEQLSLDFVYGYTEQVSAETVAFIPLDGQQRLTTLWLILWFLSPREDNFITPDYQKILENFTYDTRISSKRFCNCLVTKPLNIEPDQLLSDQIINTPWFMATWSNDPTIVSMLNMLDTLYLELIEKEEALENLTSNKKISFDLIDIKSNEFRLTDDLYIKMNSRGKPLTPFENFKAQFSDLLSSNLTDFYESRLDYLGSKITYQQYFAFRIDGVWIDLFWEYKDSVKTSIDACIYNYFNYIAEFLYYRDNPKTQSSDIKIDFEFLNKVFSTKENIDFLFKSLDFLSTIKDKKGFFNDLFEGLSTFDNYPNDYFLRAMTDSGFDVQDKILFYSILSYCAKKSLTIVDNEFKDFIRIIRNLLLAVRQPNQIKKIEYASNLRLPNVSEYCKFIDTLLENKVKENDTPIYEIFANNEYLGFPKESISNEKVKSNVIVSNPSLRERIHKLEEHSQIQGNTSNFKLHTIDITQKIEAFCEIWSEETDNSLIIRAFLTVNDFSIKTHNYSALGPIWYLGSGSYWHSILTSNIDSSRSFTDTLDLFLTKYNKVKGRSSNEKLRTIIENYKTDRFDWLYYFIKYEPITKNSFLALNLFTWNDEDGFNINSLGNSGNYPLHSYHLNPYLIVLDSFFESNKKLKLYWGRFADLSFIRVGKICDISVSNEGWVISSKKKPQIDPSLIKKYNLKQKEDYYILFEYNSKDKIETAVDFINDILQS